jgi:hypothetical protein
MRFMLMHKTNAHFECGGLPGPELVAGIGQLTAELVQAGVLRGHEGLRPSSTGVRLKFAGGKHTLQRGPLSGDNELVAGFIILRLKSIDAAIDWAMRLAAVMGDVELDVRQVGEPWDVGICPKPEGLDTTRYMLINKADANTEAGVPPGPQLIAGMKRLLGEMDRAGVLLLAEGLQASSKSLRLLFRGERCTIIDGPFAESKELIAGYCMLDLNTMDEAVYWARRFARVAGDVEVDIRPIHEMPA